MHWCLMYLLCIVNVDGSIGLGQHDRHYSCEYLTLLSELFVFSYHSHWLWIRVVTTTQKFRWMLDDCYGVGYVVVDMFVGVCCSPSRISQMMTHVNINCCAVCVLISKNVFIEQMCTCICLATLGCWCSGMHFIKHLANNHKVGNVTLVLCFML